MFKGSETIFSSSAFLRADISSGSCRLRSGADGAPGLGRSLVCTERKFLSKANEGVFAGVAMISSGEPRLQPTLMDWCCANSSWLCVGISTRCWRLRHLLYIVISLPLTSPPSADRWKWEGPGQQTYVRRMYIKNFNSVQRFRIGHIGG
jgi:hypothetical protein